MKVVKKILYQLTNSFDVKDTTTYLNTFFVEKQERGVDFTMATFEKQFQCMVWFGLFLHSLVVMKCSLLVIVYIS